MVTDIHHRKPRSLGGTNDKYNLSKVPKDRHVAYHALFRGSMTPHEIAEKLSRLLFVMKTEKEAGYLWILFGSKTLQEIVFYMNTVWIDPEYVFYIRRKNIKVKFEERIKKVV